MKIKEILKGVIYGNDYIMPLWKELLFGGLIILGFSSFCSAINIEFNCDTTTNSCTPSTFISYSSVTLENIVYSSSSSKLFYKRQCYDSNGSLGQSNNSSSFYISTSNPTLYFSNSVCYYTFIGFTDLYEDNATASFTISFPNSIVSSCPECPTCPAQYTSEECQTEYNLIPSENLTTCNNDLQSCQNSLSGYDTLLNNCSTNLNSCNSSLSSCLQLNCPVSSGGVSWSSLFINDIQHIGAPTINISIPSEIQWDYLNENDEFNLTVDGYNTDSDYIEGIINIQNSKPSKEDLNNIITKVIPLFVPGLVIILFIYFVFYLIKKIFK